MNRKRPINFAFSGAVSKNSYPEKPVKKRRTSKDEDEDSNQIEKSTVATDQKAAGFKFVTEKDLERAKLLEQKATKEKVEDQKKDEEKRKRFSEAKKNKAPILNVYEATKGFQSQKDVIPKKMQKAVFKKYARNMNFVDKRSQGHFQVLNEKSLHGGLSKKVLWSDVDRSQALLNLVKTEVMRNGEKKGGFEIKAKTAPKKHKKDEKSKKNEKEEKESNEEEGKNEENEDKQANKEEENEEQEEQEDEEMNDGQDNQQNDDNNSKEEENDDENDKEEGNDGKKPKEEDEDEDDEKENEKKDDDENEETDPDLETLKREILVKNFVISPKGAVKSEEDEEIEEKQTKNEDEEYESSSSEEENEDEEGNQQITQHDILDSVDLNTQKKVFDLKLARHGPYAFKYNAAGNDLLLVGRRGHIASLNWRKFEMNHETFLPSEHFHDGIWLMDNSMYAVAQKSMVYVYGSRGQEIHRVPDFANVKKLYYLPFHFLMVGVAFNEGRIMYKDISIGKNVGTCAGNPNDKKSLIKSKKGLFMNSINCSAMNQSNGVLGVGHSNGQVSLVTPKDSHFKPSVSMFCHSSPVTNICFSNGNPANYMITSGADSLIKVWDIRNTFSEISQIPMHLLIGEFTSNKKSNVQIKDIKISQTGKIALAVENMVQIYDSIDDLIKASKILNELTETENEKKYAKCMKKLENSVKPVLKHKVFGTQITNLEFCPYEDILGIGHSSGFTSILIPGAGESQIDTKLPNPYFKNADFGNFNVNALIDKIPHDMITLNPESVATIFDPKDLGFTTKIEKNEEAGNFSRGNKKEDEYTKIIEGQRIAGIEEKIAQKGKKGRRNQDDDEEEDKKKKKHIVITDELKENMEKLGLVSKNEIEESKNKLLTERDLLRKEKMLLNQQKKEKLKEWEKKKQQDPLLRFSDPLL